MLRISQIFRYSNVLNRNCTSVRVVKAQINLACQPHFIPSSRFYSDKNIKDSDKKVNDTCRKNKDNDEKIKLKEMRVINIDPCNPPPAPEKSVDTGKTVCERVPPRKEPPPPIRPKDNNFKKWLLGILLAAAALGAYVILTEKEPPPLVVKPKRKRKQRDIVKDPPDSSDIPSKVPYLLIGGGVGSFSAFRAIKSVNPKARILIIGDEGYYPYMRPPLSKEMWLNEDKEQVNKLNFKQWNGSTRNLYFEPPEFYTKCQDLLRTENGGVAVARGYNVKKIDVINKIAYLDDDKEIRYDKCLIATGATPKTLPILEVATQDPEVDERVLLFRNIYDFQDVFDAFEESRSVAIIGGGLLGSELACSLARKAKTKREIIQIFKEGSVMAKILPEYLSYWTTEKLKEEGVKVVDNSEIRNVKYKDEKLSLTLTNGREIVVDFAVIAVGVEPNTQLAEKSDLEVDPELGGFVVNTELQARTDLFVAGDCACFYDTQLGRRRIEHFDQAVITGRLAGENMTGSAKPYTHQGMFWSDLGPDVGFEAIGIVDSNLPTVGVFVKSEPKKAAEKETKTEQEEEVGNCGEGTSIMKSSEYMPKVEEGEDFSKGVVFYLRNDIVVGIVLWNVFNRMSTARQVIKDGKKYDDLNEVAKLFKIHEE